MSGGGATGLPERKAGPKKGTSTISTGSVRQKSEEKSAPDITPEAAANKQKPSKNTDYDLYIVHGWTYTVEPWERTLEILEKNDIHVKMLRVPGLTEASDKVYEISDYVKWADSEIPDGALALGHSNGGRILLNLCAKKPGKLSNLILLDSAGIYERSRRKAIIEKIAKIGRPLKKVPLIDKIFHKFTETTDYSKAPANMKKTLVNMLESDKNLKLGDVTTKTYILWGKKDTTTPPRQATKMYEELPNADLKFYANWTHAPYIVDPEGLARALTSLITRLKK